MLELCRAFNPELKPGPMGDHSRPEGLGNLLEHEAAEVEVKGLIKMYSGPNPDEQTPPHKIDIKEDHF